MLGHTVDSVAELGALYPINAPLSMTFSYDIFFPRQSRLAPPQPRDMMIDPGYVGTQSTEFVASIRMEAMVRLPQAQLRCPPLPSLAMPR